MIVYKCIVTGDEMFSDSYAITEIGALYEVKGKLVTETSGDIDDSLIGGNKSAEAPDEGGADSSSKSGPNVALANRYVETGFSSKKEFMVTMKAYFKKIQTHCQEKAGDSFDVKDFQAALQEAMKTNILPQYNDLQFYTGESLNPEGAIPMLLWKKDSEDSEDETPYFYYFKHGLDAMKY